MPQALAVIGAVASVGGTVLAVNQQKKAAAAQQKQQNLSTRRSQRQAIREAQIRRAQTLASAQALGGGGGSGVAGGLSSLGSQLGGSLGFSAQMSGLSNQISVASTKANTFGGIASLGNSLFSAAGGFGTMMPGSTAGGGISPEAAMSGLG